MLRDERGMALLLAIVMATILGVLGSVIALTARVETLVAGRFEQARELEYAAEGAMALALADLGGADWTAALGGLPSSFTDGDPSGVRSLPGVRPVVLCCGGGSLSSAIQQAANGGRTWGADTPNWRLYAWGPAASWLAGGAIRTPFYSSVWIADDPADNDGNPAADANQVIAVYAVALGPGDGRRAVRALVARPMDEVGRTLPRGVRIVSWHDTRW